MSDITYTLKDNGDSFLIEVEGGLSTTLPKASLDESSDILALSDSLANDLVLDHDEEKQVQQANEASVKNMLNKSRTIQKVERVKEEVVEEENQLV